MALPETFEDLLKLMEWNMHINWSRHDGVKIGLFDQPTGRYEVLVHQTERHPTLEEAWDALYVWVMETLETAVAAT